MAKGLKPAQMRTYFALTEAASLLQYAVRQQLQPRVTSATSSSRSWPN